MDDHKFSRIQEICKNLLKDRVPDSILDQAAKANALNAFGIKLSGDEKRLYSDTKHLCIIPKVAS